MRIISKFKDYYDGVQYYGQDQDLIYVRNKEYPEEKIDIETHFQKSGRYFSRVDQPYILQYPEKNIEQEHYNGFILGFCGQLYRGHIIRWEEHDFPNSIGIKKEDFYICYNQDELSIFQKQTEYSKRHKSKYNFRDNKFDMDYFKIDNQDSLKELFFKYNTPYFIIYDREKYKNNLTLNPMLSKYQFYKVKDAYTTFQDIAMFIGGVLPRVGHGMIEVSNNDLIVKRGFDTKSSFRKQKEK